MALAFNAYFVYVKSVKFKVLYLFMKKIYLNYTCFIFLTFIKKMCHMCSLVFSIHGLSWKISSRRLHKSSDARCEYYYGLDDHAWLEWEYCVFSWVLFDHNFFIRVLEYDANSRIKLAFNFLIGIYNYGHFWYFMWYFYIILYKQFNNLIIYNIIIYKQFNVFIYN